MKITTKKSEISQKIKEILVRQLYDRLKIVALTIKSEIRQKNLEIWRNSPTYESLLNGKLTHELGFKKGTAPGKVNYVLETAANSIQVIPKLSIRKFRQGQSILRINVLSRNIYADLILAPESFVETEKPASRDFSSDFAEFGAQPLTKSLPWAQWLLLEGNKYLVYNYKYVDVVDARSRSGKGLMVYDANSAWKVPAEFSGTRNNNWLIRDLTQNEKILASAYTEIINKNINGIF